LSQNSAVNDTWSIVAAIGCFAIAVQVFMIMPVYVGALADSYGFDNRQLGWLTSSELSGQAIAILIALFWIRRLSWRVIMLWSALALMACNLLSVYVDGAYTLLLLIRGLAGFAVGSILAIGCTLLGDTAQADRNFGLLIGAEVFFQVVLFALLPAYVADYGVNAIYCVLAISAVIMLLLSVLIPDQGSRHNSDSVGGKGSFRLPMLGLVGTVIFFAGIMLVWSFIERLGIARGIGPAEIGKALSISGVVSLVGALSAAALADRLGRLLPMLVGIAGILLSYWVLATQTSYWSFVLAASLLAAFWNFWLPYQMGAVAAVDLAGRYVVLIPFAQSLGVAVGPVIAGRIFVGDDFTPLMYFSAVFLLVCLVFFLPLLRTIKSHAARSGKEYLVGTS
jgi:predicted MFS family arabinose efflux permease